MAKARITDVQIKAWIRKGEPLAAKAIGGGLYFRIHDSGAQQFYFRYRFGGKPKWHALGIYPDMSLRDATDEARKCRVKVRSGVDPALEKKLAQAEALNAKTFGEVADDWYAREIESKYKHPEVVERVLRLWIKPKLGSLPIAAITPVQADHVLQAIVAANKPTIANDALRYMQRIFRFARKRRLVEINPVADFEQSDAGGQEFSRDRFLNQAELRTLLNAMDKSQSFGRSNELSVKLLLLLGVRKMELLSAKWESFDLDKKIWCLSDNKSARPMEVPLPNMAITWLQELRVLASKSDYVFPARRISRQRRRPHVGTDTLNRALDGLEHGLQPFTVHDLRRTARTHLSRLGISSEVAGRCLNHKIKGVEGTYDRHDYLEERRQALELWSAEIEALCRSDEKVVVGAFA